MNTKELKAKKRVKVTDLYEPSGIIALPEYLDNRQPDLLGILYRPMEGHDGAWWVQHDDGTIAPYWFHELSIDKTPRVHSEEGKLF